VRNLVELLDGDDRRIIDTLVGLSAKNLHELRIHE